MNSKYRGLISLTPFFRPYRREVFFAVLSLVITAIMILFFGKAIKYLIDFGFSQKDRGSLNAWFLIFIIAVITMALAGYYRSSIINAVAEKVINDLRKKVYGHVVKFSAEFFELFPTGDVISRLTVDTAVLYNVISNTISFLLRNILLFLGGIFFLFTTSIKLSLISVLLIILAILPIILMGKKIKKLSNQSQAALAVVGSHIEESISGIRTIQSYLCEIKEIKNFTKFIDDSLKISLNKINIKALMVAIVISLAFGGIAVVLWVGGHDVLRGVITSGDLSSFIFYAVISATSLVALSQIAGQLQSASSAGKRVFELLEMESLVKETADPLPFLENKEITIKFENVNFSYPTRKDFLVLQNFNLKIKPQEKIAIAGLSGAGKSTILQLLLRFYDINSGAIFLNERDIKSLSFFDLRKNFSYISQDCFIFSGTVFENIAYANSVITRVEVQNIIDNNPGLDFINQLPQGLDTFVGQKGIKLSGGERQRIAFARAIIKDSGILLFDEATSSLDNQNEQMINRSISKFSVDKTVIVIAHRLSTIINCDRIIFIRDGKIVEDGSHQELMALNGYYRKMYELEEGLY